MKRKTYLKTVISFVVVSAVLLAVSCSMACPDRLLEITIPQHSWESVQPNNLWYTLRWTYGTEVLSAYVGQDERTINIHVPVGEAVLIAAYPLGEMAPFGAIVTPLEEGIRTTLNQNDGAIVNELIDLDRTVTQRLNYGPILENMLKKCDDLRRIEKVSFLRDLQNGELCPTDCGPASTSVIQASTSRTTSALSFSCPKECSATSIPTWTAS